jgi:hypothetical protein
VLKHPARLAALALIAIALTACVAGSSESVHAASGGVFSQFCLGLWHGIIGPITLIVELINRLLPHLLPWRAHLYETQANGAAYDLGFYLGLTGSPAYLWSRRGRR